MFAVFLSVMHYFRILHSLCSNERHVCLIFWYQWCKFSYIVCVVWHFQSKGADCFEENVKIISALLKKSGVICLKSLLSKKKKKRDWKCHTVCWLCWLIFRSLHITSFTYIFFPNPVCSILYIANISNHNKVFIFNQNLRFLPHLKQPKKPVTIEITEEIMRKVEILCWLAGLALSLTITVNWQI